MWKGRSPRAAASAGTKRPSSRQCFLSGLSDHHPWRRRVRCCTADALHVTPGRLALRAPPLLPRLGCPPPSALRWRLRSRALPASAIHFPGASPPVPPVSSRSPGPSTAHVSSDTDPAASPTCSSLSRPPERMLQPPPACASQNRGVTLGSFLPTGTTSHPAHHQVLSVLCPRFPDRSPPAPSPARTTAGASSPLASLLPLPSPHRHLPRPCRLSGDQAECPPPAPGPLHMC